MKKLRSLGSRFFGRDDYDVIVLFCASLALVHEEELKEIRSEKVLPLLQMAKS